MRALALFVCLAPFAAAAQTISVTGDGSSTGPIYIGASNCGSKAISFSWTNPNALGGETYTLLAVRSVSSCASTTLTLPDKSLTTTTSTTAVVNASDLIVETASDGGSAGTTCSTLNHSSASPLTVSFCVQTTSSTLGGTTVQYGHFEVSFANLPPTPPTNLDVQPGSKHLRVSWDPGNSSEKVGTYDVHVAPQGTAFGPSPADHLSGTSSDVSRTDYGDPLVDDTQVYDVAVLATDLYGNVSALSSSVAAMPTYIYDFYNYYRLNGGSAAGGHGCATGGDAFWILALAAVGAFAARRKKASTLLLLACALAAPAQAAKYERPPQKLLFSFKIDRYDPQVDSEPGLTGTPYHDIFHGRAPLRYQLEGDFIVARPLGSILLGGTAGFWQNIGKGIVRSTLTVSSDTTLLNVLPLGVVATYRFDWLADRYRWVPLIPYAQAGLTAALWWTTTGTGSISRSDQVNGGRGSGWTYGYTTALGFALNLNAIDPSLSQEAYNDVGIQRTSLFAEYAWTRLDDFHRSGALILSDRAWRFGLSLEF